MSILKKIVAAILTLIAIGACAFLGFLFYNITFLSAWLLIILLVLCATGIIAAVWLLFMYLNPEGKSQLPPDLEEAENETETIYSEKTIYRELK